MIQRVLSIDINYIMAPDIKRYTDWIHDDWTNITQQWQMVSRKFGRVPKHCDKRSDYLLDIFKTALSSVDGPHRVIFESDHHVILEHINELSDLIIHNVDHQHDIFYSGMGQTRRLCENNWIWWLDREGAIKEYTWFGNRCSVPYDMSTPLRCKFKTVTRKNQKPMTDPDLIFVCGSPHWVPESGQELYRTMQSASHSYWHRREENEV
jgi:hypothetical protein